MKTPYVEEFNSNQLPSPTIVRKMILRGENEDIPVLLMPLQLLFHLTTRLRMGISTRNRSNMKGRDCILPANLTKYIGFLLDGTQSSLSSACSSCRTSASTSMVLKPYFKPCSLEAVLLHPLQAVLRPSVSFSMVLKLHLKPYFCIIFKQCFCILFHGAQAIHQRCT